MTARFKKLVFSAPHWGGISLRCGGYFTAVEGDFLFWPKYASFMVTTCAKCTKKTAEKLFTKFKKCTFCAQWERTGGGDFTAVEGDFLFYDNVWRNVQKQAKNFLRCSRYAHFVCSGGISLLGEIIYNIAPPQKGVVPSAVTPNIPPRGGG